jgi:hypothetical protein
MVLNRYHIAILALGKSINNTSIFNQIGSLSIPVKTPLDDKITKHVYDY